MNILASMHNEVDAFEEILFLTLLFLLVLIFKGRSLLANGTVLGAVMSLLFRNGIFLLLGFLFGLTTRIFLNARAAIRAEMEPPASSEMVNKQGPYFWIVVLATAGMSLGLTVGLVFNLTYHQTFFWMCGFPIAGGLMGAASGLVGKKLSSLRPYGELLVVLVLAGGIGAAIGWKIVGPILIFDINPPLSTETLYRIAVLACAGFGALLGLIAWSVGILRLRTNRSP